MFIPLIIFLLFELFVFELNPSTQDLPGKYFFVISSLLVVGYVLILSIFSLAVSLSSSLSNKFNINKLITSNVFGTSLGILAIHYFLVINTGGIQSPFFSALTFTALSIVGLPRENNFVVYSLSILTFIAVASFFLFDYKLDVNPWINHKTTVNTINISVLFISFALAFFLRGCSSKKIKTK